MSTVDARACVRKNNDVSFIADYNQNYKKEIIQNKLKSYELT